MGKFSVGQHGIEIETQEKSNVMTSASNMGFLICIISLILILLSPEKWIKLFGIVLIVFFVVIWLIIYITHSIKKPELLQSEKYRIERHKIEAGMLTNKDEHINTPEILTTNINPLIETNNSEDIKE